jgi:hypothetical protein
VRYYNLPHNIIQQHLRGGGKTPQSPQNASRDSQRFLVACEHCGHNVRNDRLEKHVKRVHGIIKKG